MNSFLEFRKSFAKELLQYADRKVIFKKGEILKEEDFREEKIAILVRGLIRYNHIMSNNREILFGCYRENSFLIIGELFSKNISYPELPSMLWMEVSEESEVYFISKKSLNEKVLKIEELKEKLVEYYVLFYQKKFYQMRDIQLFNIEDALLSLVVRAYNTYGEVREEKNIVNHKILNKNLAKCLACTEETVSRIIAKLKKENIIDKYEGLIEIKNMDYVEERLGCNYCKKNICYF